MSLISLTCAVFVSKVFGSRGGYGQLCGPILHTCPRSSHRVHCWPGFRLIVSGWKLRVTRPNTRILQPVSPSTMHLLHSLICVASLRIRCCVLLSIGRGNLACNWHPQYTGSDQVLDSVLNVFLRGLDVWAVDLQLLYRMRVAVHSTKLQQCVIGDILES
jgi:hypothetical protein